MSYGAQIKYGIARQTAGGTAVSAVGSFFGMPLVSEDVGLEKDELISANLIGRFEQGAVYDGVSRVKGTIEFEVTPLSLLQTLMAGVQYNPSNATSGSLKTMGWLPNTVDFDATYVKAPITIYKQFSDASSAEQFYDCQFSGIELTLAQGQFLKGKTTVAGGARTATGIGSMNVMAAASDVDDLFPWNVSSISLGGSAIGQNSELTVSLNENIDALYTINGTLNPFKYTRTGFREVTISGTLYMNDRTILNSFTAGTQARLLVTIQNTRAEIQSGYYNTLIIDVPQMKFTAFKPGASGPGEVAVQFTARGVLDPSSFYAVKFTTITTYSGTGF